jgi:hypothetical protein
MPYFGILTILTLQIGFATKNKNGSPDQNFCGGVASGHRPSGLQSWWWCFNHGVTICLMGLIITIITKG